jgi:hypothetical protein
MAALATFKIDDVEWTEYEWIEDCVIWQRVCPHCDNGLLLAPARFCGACLGSGFIISLHDPRGE